MRRAVAPTESGMVSALVAIDRRSDALLQKFPLGESIEVMVRRNRSLPMHNLFRAILRHVAGNSAWETDEKLLHGLKVYLGKYDRVLVPNGKTIIVPHSTSFSEMDQEEFAEFFQRSIQAICEFVIPGTNSDDLVRQVEVMLHTRDSGDRQDRPQEENDGTPGPSGGATPPAEEAPSTLAVPIRAGARQGTSDWAGTAEDMVARIEKLTDPADTAPGGRFNRENSKTLEMMRTNHQEARRKVQYALSIRDGQLRQGPA